MRTTPWKPTKEDIGWLAGIIDGEGSIYAALKDSYPYFRYSFQIVNTNREMLDKFQRILSGICDAPKEQFKVFPKKYTVGIVGKKQCYALQIRRMEDMKRVLTATLPHLTEKREKAKFFLGIANKHKRFQRYKAEGFVGSVETE